MHSCFSTDLILRQFISKLNLSAKFGVQGVCQRWKNIATECLRQHQHLVIAEYHRIPFWCHSNCDEHLPLNKNDNLIWGKQTDLEFWQRTLPLLQAVKYVYIDAKIDVEIDAIFTDYKPILQLLIESCGQSLECLCIPDHDDDEDETFPLTDSLPNLKHLVLAQTTSQVTKNILTACRNLEYLRLSTSFTGWQILPKGFKKLETNFEDLEGIISLLSSPAVESLEVINTILMASEIYYQPYHLSCLKSFDVTIDFDVTNCLSHLARILSFAPVLLKLMIRIAVFDEIESQVWIKVLSECKTVTSLTVYLNEPIGTENPLIDVSSWQDDFAKTIVSKMKKLEYLNIRFHLSSDGLRLLSTLENLGYFRHEIHTENMSYDSVFDTDALTDFLSSSFDKTLTEYHIHIPFGEHLILKESFYDFIEKMERKHFLRFYMQEDNRHYDNETVHPDKIPGMIYVTALDVYEWGLMRPSFENIEKDDIKENLLIAVTDTQSHVENMFLGNTT